MNCKVLMPGTNVRESRDIFPSPTFYLESVTSIGKLQEADSVCWCPRRPSHQHDDVTQSDSISDVWLLTISRSHPPASRLLQTWAGWSESPRGPSLGASGNSVRTRPDPYMRTPPPHSAPPGATGKLTPVGSKAFSDTPGGLPCCPRKASLWEQWTFPFPLEARVGSPVSTSEPNFGWEFPLAPKWLWQTGQISSSSSSSPSFFSHNYYYFWLNPWKVICRHYDDLEASDLFSEEPDILLQDQNPTTPRRTLDIDVILFSASTCSNFPNDSFFLLLQSRIQSRITCDI